MGTSAAANRPIEPCLALMPMAILCLSKPFVVAGPKTGLRGTTDGFFLLVDRVLASATRGDCGRVFLLNCPGR